MRLLNAHTLELKNFFGTSSSERTPPYAILSHCWEDDEVLFADLSDLETARKKKGFTKIQKTCEQTIKDKLKFVWIDTCCIDKSSSAELSEAINSMFAWYQESYKCYAYLADVEVAEDFAKSRWFTRGWTLQELLAPRHVRSDTKLWDRLTPSESNMEAVSGMDFFLRDWIRLGSKRGLSTAIATITGVAKEYLEGASLGKASISMRMSWAAERFATRSEDIAYSLLGIFDVNMPLLYGEGRTKAFRRLQEEIMKVSEDETIFAWESMEFGKNASSMSVLASEPGDFVEAKNLIPFTSDDPIAPYAMTHRGLRIDLQLYKPHSKHFAKELQKWARPLRSPIMIWSNDDLTWAALRCHVVHDFHHYVMIPLYHLTADVYARDGSTNIALFPVATLSSLSPTKQVYIRNNDISSTSGSTHRRYGFLMRTMPIGFSIADVVPRDTWDPKAKIIQGDKEATGPRDWHASLKINITPSKALPGINSVIFVSVGCKPAGVEPKPWCYLDDTAHAPDDGHLELFHRTSSWITPQPRSVRRLWGFPQEDTFSVEVGVSTETLFGQRMFVVDINKLKVSELYTHETSSTKRTHHARRYTKSLKAENIPG
jgi:hypothetical protein